MKSVREIIAYDSWDDLMYQKINPKIDYQAKNLISYGIRNKIEPIVYDHMGVSIWHHLNDSVYKGKL